MNRADLPFWCLLGALVALALVFAFPRVPAEQSIFSFLFVVDITRSMNTVDYELKGRPASRLEFVKNALHEVLPRFPCGSRVGLGLFTERDSAILFRPVETCDNYSAIDGAIARIDWRMAWAADSNIAQGLYNTIKLLKGLKGHFVFMTDGQEAPPINPRYQSNFKELTGESEGARILAKMKPISRPRSDHRPGAVKGLIVGVGGYTPAPIPKFNESGEQIGFYSADDVPHASRFGLAAEDARQIPGHDPRNAPFGSEPAVGGEHLSSVREAYLQELAAKTGLVYHYLENAGALNDALPAKRVRRTHNHGGRHPLDTCACRACDPGVSLRNRAQGSAMALRSKSTHNRRRSRSEVCPMGWRSQRMAKGFVSNQHDAAVAVIDTLSLRLLATVGVGTYPEGVAG